MATLLVAGARCHSFVINLQLPTSGPRNLVKMSGQNLFCPTKLLAIVLSIFYTVPWNLLLRLLLED